MGSAATKPENQNIAECIRQTAEKHGVTTAEVLAIVGDIPEVKEVYGLTTDGGFPRDVFFTTPELRQVFADAIEAGLVKVKGDSQCIDNKSPNANDLAKWIRTTSKLGQGSFGTVYKACAPPKSDGSAECDDDAQEFAIKLAAGKKMAVKTGRQNWWKTFEWREAYLTEIVQDKVLNGKLGQAVPRIYREFNCVDKCTINDQPGKSCAITLMELGDGTLATWFEKTSKATGKISKELCDNALFQIMAGLAALQSPGLQIHHADVKIVNILFYEVRKGGYWRYDIGDQTYYLPNLGFVFILADYGVSTPQTPDIKYQHQNRSQLGARGLIRDPEKGMCYLVSISKSTPNLVHPLGMAMATFMLQDIPNEIKSSLPQTLIHNNFMVHGQKLLYGPIEYNDAPKIEKAKFDDVNVEFHPPSAEEYLEKVSGLDAREAILGTGLLNRPDIYPPVQFGYDTQDAIRTFIGGKRVGQPGTHMEKYIHLLDGKFVSELEKYRTTQKDDTNEYALSFYNHKMFAQDFIHHYFDGMYQNRSEGKELSKFKCSL